MKTTKIISAMAIFSFVSIMAADVWAQAEMKHNMENMGTGAAVNPAADMTSGEVLKIDREAGRVTIKHGRIENLNMGAMTMIFGVKDKGMLDTIKVGDKIKFKATMEDGNLMVTEIKAAAE